MIKWLMHKLMKLMTRVCLFQVEFICIWLIIFPLNSDKIKINIFIDIDWYFFDLKHYNKTFIDSCTLAKARVDDENTK